MKQIIPTNLKIDFIALRKQAFFVSSLLVCISLLSSIFIGLNFGIDFKGGYTFEIQMPEGSTLSDVRQKLSKLKLGDVKVRSFDNKETNMIINMERQEKVEHEQIVKLVKESLGENVNYRKVDLLGAKITGRMIKNAILAVLFSLIAMLIYVWLRFEWQFSVGAVITQIHDVILVLGCYSVFGIEFNATAIIAILTTLGYSINNTVVIYDRIRENLGRFEDKNMRDIINLSTNDTLARNILTSGTTLLALFALYWFGGLVLSVFILPIICGVLFGAFSSIFLAAPILMYMPINRDSFSNKDSTDNNNSNQLEIDEVPIK